MEEEQELPLSYGNTLPYDNTLVSISIAIRDHSLIPVNITTNEDGRQEWRADKRYVPRGISLFISTSCDIGEVCEGPQDITRITTQFKLGDRTPLQIVRGENKYNFDESLKHTYTGLSISHDPSNTTSLSPLTKVNRYYNKKYSRATGDCQVEFNDKKINSSGLTIIEMSNNITSKIISDTLGFIWSINHAEQYTRQQIIDGLARLGFQNIFMFDLTCNQYEFNRRTDFSDFFDDSPRDNRKRKHKQEKEEKEFREFEERKKFELLSRGLPITIKGGKKQKKQKTKKTKNKK